MDPEERARQQAERGARKRARAERKERRRSRRGEGREAPPPPGRLLQRVTAADPAGLEALARRLPRSDLEGAHLARLQHVLRATEAMLQAASPVLWQLLPRLEEAVEPSPSDGREHRDAVPPMGHRGGTTGRGG